jgi:hypothetical protein
MPGTPERLTHAMPNIEPSTPHMFVAVTQHGINVMPSSIGAGHDGAGAGGSMQTPLLSDPHVLVAGFAQHGGETMMGIGMPPGMAGAVHVNVPHGTGAIAAVPAVTVPNPAKPAAPPAPPVPTGVPVVPSSPPHPNTLTKQASATAVHHALFIAGNPLRAHGRARAPGEQLSITKGDISVHGYCSKGAAAASRGSRVLSLRRNAV